MIAPKLLLGAALLLWGGVSGQWLAAIPLALLIEVLRLRPPALLLDDLDRNRISDLCTLLSIAVGVYFLATAGLPLGLLKAFGWAPFTLAPMILAQIASGQPFRVRNLFLSLRRSQASEADQDIDLLSAYFALLILATGVLAAYNVLFYLAMVALVGLWLYFAYRPQLKWLPFLLALAIASGAGFLFGQGLHRMQGALETFFVDSLGGDEADAYQASTRIGSLGEVKLSDSIVWRVQAYPTPALPLLLRDGAYSRFDGKNWFARSEVFRSVPNLNQHFSLVERGRPITASQHLELYGHARKGHAMLALPMGAVTLDGLLGHVDTNSLGVVKLDEAPDLLRFEVLYDSLSSQYPAPLLNELSLTAGQQQMLQGLVGEPELQGLARRTEAERVQGIRQFFANHFRYSLALGEDAANRKDVARFLLKDRSGHCEYFATATVLLLRANGIPARYVTGFSVQEYSRLEGAFVVRSRHAHAWAEAFVAGRWTAVDTTPPDWFGAEAAQASVWQPVTDFFSWLWAKILLWKANGLPLPRWLLWPLGLGLMVWMLRALRQRRRQPQTRLDSTATAQPSAYQVLERALAARGFARPPAETPKAWLARLRNEGCEALLAGEFAQVDELVAQHYRACYSLDAPA